MDCELAMQCSLIYGVLKFALPEDMITVDLNIHMAKGIHTFKRTTRPKHHHVVYGEQKCNPTLLYTKG